VKRGAGHGAAGLRAARRVWVEQRCTFADAHVPLATQAMLHGSALVPENYGEAMRLWSDPQYRMDNTHTYQLPFVRPVCAAAQCQNSRKPKS
jgi:hypothetical protein